MRSICKTKEVLKCFLLCCNFKTVSFSKCHYFTCGDDSSKTTRQFFMKLEMWIDVGVLDLIRCSASILKFLICQAGVLGR